MRKLGIALIAAALAACIAVAPSPAPGPAPGPGPGKSQGHGPPPHAPAHGYRAKTQHGVEIVFDTGIGVYVAVDLPGLYWLDGRYYRKGTAGWQVSAGFDGPWAVCVTGDLPAGLRVENAKPGKGNSQK
jgi:hypothetical protein